MILINENEETKRVSNARIIFAIVINKMKVEIRYLTIKLNEANY